jgi:hypothetical protein
MLLAAVGIYGPLTAELDREGDQLLLPLSGGVTPEYFDVLGQRIVAGRKFPRIEWFGRRNRAA